MAEENIKAHLDRLYRLYNNRRYVHPDPIEFLYSYGDIRDREIAGLVASSLAYGRVAQILKSVARVLDIMNPSPYRFLKQATYAEICRPFEGFTHRFATGGDIAALLWGLKGVIDRFGSIYECFSCGMSPGDDTVFPALTYLTAQLTAKKKKPGHLVPDPQKGSACKRLNLYLRWMVRKDRVDPGGWDGIPAGRLIVPLDIHMHRIGLALCLTRRNQANLRTALEITSAFRTLEPDDPLKYDFALTRFGIRNDLDLDSLTALLPTGHFRRVNSRP